jgi:glycosyltransferase involved in cell wall biosynthesis
MTRRTGMRTLRIAMIGQKGIPARYGGVETHVENVGARLAERGHAVFAFCRSRFRPTSADIEVTGGYGNRDGRLAYRGVRLLFRPSVNTKHLDAATHTGLAALEAGLRHRFDIVHFHGIGPSAFAPIPRLLRRRVVSTFHALDWRQVKWGHRATSLLKRGEARGARRSHGVIAVSRIMQEYVRTTYGVEAEYIPNGASIGPGRGTGSIGRWGLEGGDYILTVGRIIRDRELHTLIESFQGAGIDPGAKLVIVGAENPPTEYSDQLRDMAGDRVVFTGEVFGESLEDLYANCRFYVLASRVEGLPITVCEAMAHSRPLVLSDIPENREVGGDAAKYFKCGDGSALQGLLEDVWKGEQVRLELSGRARRRAEDTYNWDRVTEQIESFYYRLMDR